LEIAANSSLKPRKLYGKTRAIRLDSAEAQNVKEKNMNRKTLSMIAASALIAVTGVTSAHAQDARVKAHIPFAFTVSGATLPAGDYDLAPAISPEVWEIRSEQGSPTAFAAVRQGDTNTEDSAKLVFNRYGDSYFLSEIRCLGETTEVPASKAERALKREMARNGSKPESVYVLASAR
jgi:hypothetical protein